MSDQLCIHCGKGASALCWDCYDEQGAKDLEAARARIAELEEQLLWKPISTAPTDENELLLRAPADEFYLRVGVGEWNGEAWEWTSQEKPSHWMRIPRLPGGGL